MVASDGEEALALLEERVPSLIVTDLQMPRLDGAQLCDRLRTSRATEDVPIVVLTAAHRIDHVRARVDAVLRKPFDVDALLETVAQFIRPTLPPKASAATPSVRLTLGPLRPTFILYVTANSTSSQRAQRTVKQVAHEQGMTLEVVDVATDAPRAQRDGVAMTPMLVRTLGAQRDVFLGDLSDPALIDEFVAGR
jgi:CheY-like chemotaxis protein